SIIKEVFNRLSELNWVVFAIGLTSTLILLLFKKYLPRIPGPLIVVVLGIVIAYFFNLQSFGVNIFGELSQVLPSISFHFFTFHLLAFLNQFRLEKLLQQKTIIHLNQIKS